MPARITGRWAAASRLEGLADRRPQGFPRGRGRLVVLGRRHARRVYLGALNVQGDIEPYGSRPAAAGQAERPVQVPPDRRRVVYPHRTFRYRPDDPADVQLLEAHLADAAAGAQIGPLHLAGEEQARRGIEPGGGQPGYGVGAAGAGGHQGHAQVAGVLAVGLGGDCRGLLVQVAHVLQAGRAAQRIDQVHRAAAGQQEHVPHARLGHPLHHVV